MTDISVFMVESNVFHLFGFMSSSCTQVFGGKVLLYCWISFMQGEESWDNGLVSGLFSSTSLLRGK